MYVSCNGGEESRSFEDRITKKVRFKERNNEESVDMVADLEPTPTLSWKDKLLGEGLVGSGMRESVAKAETDGEFVLLEGNMVKSTINGIPTINFSDRIKDILFKEMEKTVVLKLLERKSRHNQMDFQVNKDGISSNTRLNSRFAALNREGDFEEIIGGFVKNFSRKRFITKKTLNNKGKGARVQENYKNKSALKAKVDCLTVSGLENKNGPTAMLGVSAGMEIRLGCSQGGPSSKAIGKCP
ncbi:hypothetical protein Goarm_013161 [Gossypium armourianum]|uniref:Uncharacterized protein n=1 Tax=Gossypium armourianum TaxID=34283 RepID=A0A7J9J297_9ROSI|nr:hypothetical protein [Gossypium armourianum]